MYKVCKVLFKKQEHDHLCNKRAGTSRCPYKQSHEFIDNCSLKRYFCYFLKKAF